jgi:ADP-ribose pyrophosphatase YjhB (NUDIX family)
MTDQQRNPFPTTDAIIELNQTRIVLIERKNPPAGLALPGGFVDEGETVEDACRREALEETGLTISLSALLGVYSDPDRDPRFHTMSVVYIAQANGVPTAGDDASATRVVNIDDIPELELAFDHRQILDDYLRYRTDFTLPRPR